MAERWCVVKVEHVAGAPTFDNEEQALGEATLKVKGDDEPRAVVRVHAEIKPEPEPQVVVTRFE